jgi:hypothetical protein
METKILNFDTLSKGNLDVYIYRNGYKPVKGVITGLYNFRDTTYSDTVSIMVHASGTFDILTFDIIKVIDNNTDHLEIKYEYKRPTFITTSKPTLMDFMRKEILTSPHAWTGKLNIQSNIQRKNMASEWYHELVKLIKNL